jgi:polyisoprenoid-binding protein YceI
MTFKSRYVEVTGENTACLVGDMTIRDVTREVVINVEYLGQAKSPWGTTSVGFSGSTRINRTDFGLTWNKALETGGVLVSDEVEIALELELVQMPEAEPVAAG